MVPFKPGVVPVVESETGGDALTAGFVAAASVGVVVAAAGTVYCGSAVLAALVVAAATGVPARL
jgi:hypothetical protein